MWAPSLVVSPQIWRGGQVRQGTRTIPEETPIAMTYNGGTHAVMMGTPQDLDDFALGFSRSEGIIDSPSDIESLDIVSFDDGLELRMWLSEARSARLAARRRKIVGATGCGLCGIESIAEATKRYPPVGRGNRFSWLDIVTAMGQLSSFQKLNHETRAVHAAACWHQSQGMVAIREDVGRHNAVDKLSGFLLRTRVPPQDCILLLSSRLSVEIIQKAAAADIALVVSISAPTALAVRTADDAGITLIAIARGSEFEAFTHCHRIQDTDDERVAADGGVAC
jgi:FdhD protein